VSDSLAVQLARVDEQLKALRQIAEGVRFVADRVNTNAERLAVHEERFSDMRNDIAEFKGELKKAVDDIRTSCNNLGEILRAQERVVSSVKNEQDSQKRALTKREKWLLALATIFGGGAVTLIVNLITQHSQ
jgi:chromosome segregation ATPase